MQVLFVGNANSFLLINLAIKLKEYFPSIEIDILSESEAKTKETSVAFRTVYAINNQSKWSRKKYIKVLWYAWHYRLLISQIRFDYDAIHIFYLSSIYRLIWRQLKGHGKKVVISVFGSEFYRANVSIKLMQAKMVRDAKVITAANEQTLKQFSAFFKVPENKQQLCRFGLSVLDEIGKVSPEEVLEFRKIYKVPANSLMIACGYNASVNQNLEAIIEQINSVKETLKNVVLFFQFPNASSKSYTEKIVNLLKVTGIPHVVLAQTFTDKELAIYRKSVDVFIQVQNTDQLSGAMQEFLFAGCNVITGSWLPYKVLDDMKIDYLKVDNLNEIGNVLKTNLKRQVNSFHNREMIKSLSGWDKNIVQWRGLYGSF